MRKCTGKLRTTIRFFIKLLTGLQKRAERIGEEALAMPGTLSISYTTDLREQVDNMLGALDEVIVVLIISAGMLAFVGTLQPEQYQYYRTSERACHAEGAGIL